DSGRHEDEVAADLCGRVRANERRGLGGRCIQRELDLDDHADGRADDQRGEPEQHGELRIAELSKTLLRGAICDPCPPAEDGAEHDRAEDRAPVEVPGPERDHIRRRRESRERDVWTGDAVASKQRKRDPEHAHADPPERARVEMREERVLIEVRSEEHTSELQSRGHLVCRLLLEKKKKKHATSLTAYV